MDFVPNVVEDLVAHGMTYTKGEYNEQKASILDNMQKLQSEVVLPYLTKWSACQKIWYIWGEPERAPQ